MHSAPGSAGRPARRRRRDDLPLIGLSVAGVTGIALVGVLLLVHLRHAGVDHDRRAAERQAQLAAIALAPRITKGVERGDPRAVPRHRRTVRSIPVRDLVARIKVWAHDGRILYSDERGLIGER